MATARTTMRRSRLIIFDEPTACLSRQETNQLFRRIRGERVAILYIVARQMAEAGALGVVLCARNLERGERVASVAGLTGKGGHRRHRPGHLDRVMDVNARAPLFRIHHAVPHTRRAGGGGIVNVISIAAHGGAPFIAAYVASRSALVGPTKNLAHALRHAWIRVNGLNMGWTSAPGEEQIRRRAHERGDDWLAEIERTRPFGRLLRPEWCARSCSCLWPERQAAPRGSHQAPGQAEPLPGPAVSPPMARSSLTAKRGALRRKTR